MLVHDFVNRKVMPVVQELYHAKTLFISETVLNAIRIHVDYAYSAEFGVEPYFQYSPLMIIRKGTNEIQHNIIARQVVSRGSVAP